MGEGTCWNCFALDQFIWRSFRRQWRRDRFPGLTRELFWKFFDETLCRPRARFAKRANGAPGNVVADRLQCARIFCYAAAAQHALGDFFHPKRAFTARRALAARFVSVKFVDVVEHPD